ncbi:MAG TPA: ATP-binding protein [Cytophagales bacterium]|nr:ATP-binding protein [Cytophagales bacterium]HAA18188.1 ATP-binding protein [Cytophagales bacterium]HAP59781.1 ATP-binding protein [Cytophagales bacterium]
MITVKNLSFTYPGGESPAVKSISFSVKKGEVFGFLGPSGAGKSTTQKVLIQLLKGYDGEVTILDKPLNGWGSEYFEHIGVGFELPNHYQKLTALENLQFFGSFFSQGIQDPMPLLERVGLAEAAKKRVSEFSKGMKMRLNFVRALLHNPQILFLDEPTSGLDPGNARIIKDIIREQKEAGKTIFLTTHNMHDADELCDRVAFMIDGELALVEAPKALKMKRGERKVRVEVENGQLQSSDFPLVGIGENADFLNMLRNPHLRTIHSLEPTLEDIFIQETGQHLS